MAPPPLARKSYEIQPRKLVNPSHVCYANLVNRRNVILIVFVAIALVVLFAVIKYGASTDTPDSSGGSGMASPQTQPGSTTRAQAPANIVVPDKTAVVPENIAVPEVVAPASPVTNSSYRSFTMKMQAGAFSPNTVIVKEGDTTRVTISAADANYDFIQPDYLGNKISIAKGQSWMWQFDATAAGKFTFYCPSCGGPSKGPIGYLIVAPK